MFGPSQQIEIAGIFPVYFSGYISINKCLIHFYLQVFIDLQRWFNFKSMIFLFVQVYIAESRTIDDHVFGMTVEVNGTKIQQAKLCLHTTFIGSGFFRFQIRVAAKWTIQFR